MYFRQTLSLLVLWLVIGSFLVGGALAIWYSLPTE